MWFQMVYSSMHNTNLSDWEVIYSRGNQKNTKLSKVKGNSFSESLLDLCLCLKYWII